MGSTTPPCKVFLTITSTMSSIENEKLVINWENACFSYPDWIAIYLNDPYTTNVSSVYKMNIDEIIKSQNNSRNYRVTNVTIGHIYFPEGWDKRDIDIPKRIGPKCLPYYIVSYKQNRIQILDCIAIQPNWMSHQIRLNDAELQNIFLPGTHCSGCYYNMSATQSNTIQLFGITQHFDVWQQLVMGIRFLDLTISFRNYEGSNKFWIVNEGLVVNKLENILTDIRKFVVYSGEIVLLNIQIKYSEILVTDNSFLHWDLIQYLNNELGDVAVMSSSLNKYSHSLTLNDIRKTGRSLIIMYYDEKIVEGEFFFNLSFLLYSKNRN